MTNVIIANLAKSRLYKCPPLYQYNYGMVLKITGIQLPDAYEVDFANDISGQSITQIGNADGVTIPSQFFQPGQAIYAWLRVHPTVDSGITTTTIVIPISPRATITDEEPTPEEQSAIDEAIAALNDAVDRAEDAVEHYPTITNGIWYVWDVDAGEYVSTGIPAQGAQGNPGTDGQDGADGLSPIATVTQTETGATISITDKQGTTTANISNGQDGAPGQPGTDGTDGVSPTVTVTDITGGHRITITDATGAHSFDVMNGQDGQGAVQDVQVNGDSVVTDGVANVPIGSTSGVGVVKADGNLGSAITSSGVLYPVYARNTGSNRIQLGTNQFNTIVPYNQHESTFYGLAKAAGDSTLSSSSNAVGQYTDAAKIAIQKMLGIYEAPWELIREDTFTNATEADHIITVDGNGEPFELTDVYIELWLPEQATEATVGKNGRIDYYYDASQYFTTYHGTKTQSANSYPNGTFALLKNDNGATLAVYANYNTMGTDRVTVAARGRTNGQKSLLIVGDYTFNKLYIYAITGTAQYRLYGKRKWQ